MRNGGAVKCAHVMETRGAIAGRRLPRAFASRRWHDGPARLASCTLGAARAILRGGVEVPTGGVRRHPHARRDPVQAREAVTRRTTVRPDPVRLRGRR